MSVWITVPSARPPEVVREWAKAWRERRYKIMLWRDKIDDGQALLGSVDTIMHGQYPGYANAVNEMIRERLTFSADADWFVVGGDDMYPDTTKGADQLASELCEHFAQLHMDLCECEVQEHAGTGTHPATTFARTLTGEQMETFGVCQFTGDRWGENPTDPNPKMRSAYIDRVAGSAWIGREFAKRVNGGKGPLWPDYTHMGVDEELQAVAEKLGVFWQRPDLTQLHQHWGRPKPGEALGDIRNMPEFLKAANSPQEWKRFKQIFEGRKAAGFPGSEPI